MKTNSFAGGLFRTVDSASLLALNKSRVKILSQLFFILTSFLGASFFAACSEMKTEPMDPNSPALSISKGTILALAQPEGGLIQIDALSGSIAPEGASFRSTTAPGVDKGRFNITLKYVVPVSDRQLEVFEAAAARWERIIIKDVPSFTATIPSAFIGFPPVADNETIDDIIIEVAIAPIDGEGGILGQAGPRFVRNADALTVSGVMFFDVADLEFLEELDLFEEVIVHEMGHVLGIGTLWNFGGRTLRQGPLSNPYFNGRTANVYWMAEGGTDFVPIENMGGAGTVGSHWREVDLRNELMTGFLNLGENPLSRITAGSLRDLGYGTSVVGERYELSRGTVGVPDNARVDASSSEGIHIAEMEMILEPIGVVSVK